mgnify:CR=1 FL=1
MRNAPHYTRASEADYWRSLPLIRLRRMLRALRKRGVEGHWDYDLPRHRHMIEVYRARKQQKDHVS